MAVASVRGVAARLNSILESHDFERMGKLTASFGVAAYRAKDTPQTLLKRVDEALYRAKENGRNRVETSP